MHFENTLVVFKLNMADLWSKTESILQRGVAELCFHDGGCSLFILSLMAATQTRDLALSKRHTLTFMFILKLNYINTAIEFSLFKPKIQHMDELQRYHNQREITMTKINEFSRLVNTHFASF